MVVQRFFDRAWKPLKTVLRLRPAQNTLRKQGVNDKNLGSSNFFLEAQSTEPE